MQAYITSPVGARTAFNGREMDCFTGTGYLGLQSRPEVIEAAVAALRQYGFSTAASRGGLGEHPLFDALEAAACAFFGSEKTLHFPTGYLGAAILTQATARQFDHVFIDASAHFSLWDAAQATNAPITPFAHRDPASLAQQMRRELRPGERPLALTDGLFPISGEIAPLPEYLELVKGYDGRLYVDDAHAVGVLGETGRGATEHFHITDPACRACATLAKGLGGVGGVLWGEARWIDAVERAARVCVGASYLSLPDAAASARALELARGEPELRVALRANVALARRGLRALGWELDEDSPSPILCLAARPGLALERLQRELLRREIAVDLVRGYTSAPPGGALRVAVFATHTAGQIERLVDCLTKLV